MTFSFSHDVPEIYIPKRIDAYLAQTLEGEFSRQEIKAAIEAGKVFLNGKSVRPRDMVSTGNRIEADFTPKKAFHLAAEKIPLKIIFEDASLIVVEKPYGMVVHPGAGNKEGTLVNALLGHGASLSSAGGRERPGIVHRLDKDTSGILLVAKNNASHKALQSQFASRSLSKTYTALVKGVVEFEEGRILEPIGHDPKVRTKMAIVRDEKGREAESHYRVLRRFRYTTLLEVRIVTGRTHQIRVHMTHLGYPVVGDPIYGSSPIHQKEAKPLERLCLHASKIEFLHPKSGKLMKFESSVPEDMAAVIRQAGEAK